MSGRRTRLSLTAAGAALLVALSGCGADQKDANTSSADRGDVPAAGAPAMQQEQGAAAPGAGPAKEPNKIPENITAETRSIIYSGTMTVRVENVDDAGSKAIAIATAAGGFVGGDNRQSDDRRSRGTIVLRIPADKFTSTLEQLKGLGDEEARMLTAQDVTDQVVDVDSRLQTAQASVERIRALLARANTIGEITTLESELSRREADLESLQSRKRRLDGLTSLSTITLSLLGPEAALAEEETGIGVGFRDGLSAFMTSLQVALTVLGWLIPWFVLLGLPVWLFVWLLRRFRAKRPAAPAPALAVAGPGMPMRPMPPFPGARPTAPHPQAQPPAQPQATFPTLPPVAAPPVSAPPVSSPPAATTEPKPDVADDADAPGKAVGPPPSLSETRKQPPTP